MLTQYCLGAPGCQWRELFATKWSQYYKTHVSDPVCCRFWYLLGVEKSLNHAFLLYLLGVKTKIPNEHLRPFHMSAPPPTPKIKPPLEKYGSTKLPKSGTPALPPEYSLPSPCREGAWGQGWSGSRLPRISEALARADVPPGIHCRIGLSCATRGSSRWLWKRFVRRTFSADRRFLSFFL